LQLPKEPVLRTWKLAEKLNIMEECNRASEAATKWKGIPRAFMRSHVHYWTHFTSVIAEYAILLATHSVKF